MPNKFLNEIREDPAVMSINVNVEESWAPEPELLESVPRRITAFEDYPDRNRPNVPVIIGISAVLLVAGFALFLLALLGRGGNLLIGLVLISLGVAGAVYFPYRLRAHLMRSEHLATMGLPVMARILSADNLNGDIYARNVKYQVTIPGGELTHKEVNADDRALPKRIPVNVTALMDMESGDVELYLALPFRAVRKAQVAAMGTPAGQAQQTAPEPAQTMGTVQTPVVPEIKRDQQKEDTKKTTKTYE